MQKKKKRIIGRVLAVIALIGLINWGYFSYHRRHSPYKADAQILPEVTAVKPQNREITVTYTYIGQVEAINDTQIVPFISGYVEEIKVNGGETVKKDDILAVVKQDEYIAAVTAASGELSAAEADLINTKSQYERLQKAGTKAISQTELDSAKAAYLAAAGNLEKAKAQHLTAETNYEYTYLRAPFDGILGNIDISLGDYISPASRDLMQLVQYDPIRVVFSISDKEYLKHFQKKDNPALILRLKLADGEIYSHIGTIKYAANIIDAQTDSLAIYSEFSNPEGKLLPNAYVEVLLEQTFDDVFLLAKPEVILEPDGDYVYTVDSDILQRRKINILGEYENQYVIKNDFTPAEFLVTEEIDSNMLNQKVKIINPQSDQSSPTEQ